MPELPLGRAYGGGTYRRNGADYRRVKDENAVWLTVRTIPEILRYVVEKGSVAIDGVSLTVAYVDEAVFKVSVIPHTQEETTLTGKRVGDVVNLENDMIVKYVEKLMKQPQTKRTEP